MLQPGPRQARGVFAGAGYGMGWYTGPLGGVDASYHFGDAPHAHMNRLLSGRSSTASATAGSEKLGPGARIELCVRAEHQRRR